MAAVVAIALSYFLPIIGFKLFWTAFTATFASTYIITGNFKSALKAGLVAGAVAFVGGQFANTGGANAAEAGSRAASGGVNDVVQGTSLAEAAPAATSASAGAAVSSGISAFDVVTQIAASIDPEAGAILSFINGGNIDFSSAAAVGGTIQNMISHYGKFKAMEELERFARKNGMTLAELNLALVTMSFVGNKVVGTRFEAKNYNGDPNAQGIHGMFDRQGFNDPVIDPINNRNLNRIIGSPFDVIDVVLGYTGILTASDYDFIRRGNSAQRLHGHSLGTLGVSNLVSRGYLDAGLAHLDSLPFGNIAPAGVELDIGTIDPVNGFFFGKIFNPSANLVSKCLHPLTCYHPTPY